MVWGNFLCFHPSWGPLLFVMLWGLGQGGRGVDSRGIRGMLDGGGGSLVASGVPSFPHQASVSVPEVVSCQSWG